MAEDGGIQHGGEPDDPLFRIVRAAYETGRVAALNEGIEDETTIIVIAQIGEERGASFSTLDPAEHLAVMARALQDFADKTEQPIEVMLLNTEGGQG